MNRPAEPLLFALGNFFSLAHVLFANVLLVGLLPWAVLMAVLGQLLHPVGNGWTWAAAVTSVGGSNGGTCAARCKRSCSMFLRKPVCVVCT